MKRSVTTFLSVIAMISLTACETAKGVGRDIQNAGEAVTETAEDIDG